jgi:hypothetical protein
MTRIVQFPVVPRLSCILCSRNDEYMGNSRWRLETSLNYLGEQAAALGYGPDDIEVIVTDWGSAAPLADVVRLTPAAHRLTRFLHVPPALARARQGASPFPEVLALNAAARRATGSFIGRIDQDTLVGPRFLRWCIDGAPDPAVLYFANRRDLPYRLAAASPSLATISRFVAEHGRTMPVHRENPFAGHIFWTSAVGIWLVSGAVWQEAAGYDERLIFYNSMETDMIHRLRADHPIVDLGSATDWDFYHLEHYHPLHSWVSRTHATKNPDVDLLRRAADRRPSGDGWGLVHEHLDLGPATRPPVAVPPERPVAYAAARLRTALWSVVDPGVTAVLGTSARLRARTGRTARALSATSPAAWPGVVRSLWHDRAAGRASRAAGWSRLRRAAAAVAADLGMLRWMRRRLVAGRLALDGNARDRAVRETLRFREFQARRAHVWPAAVETSPGRRALVISSRCPSVEAELATLTAIRKAGFVVTVLLEDEERALAPFYEFGGAVMPVPEPPRLAPGGDPVIDRLCEAIATGMPFIDLC